jgi:hypothetical protein
MKLNVGKMRDLLTDHLAGLLLRTPEDEREYQMSEIDRLLWEAFGSAVVPGRRDSPQAFATDVFQENPATLPLVENALEKSQGNPDWRPASETPDDLVASLLPSDHHLE